MSPPHHLPLRVLIIEDDLDAAEMLREVVELGAYEVKVAHDGPMGLALARAFTPDIVLCDIGLPGMDGYEVARAMRVDQALRSSYLIALTGCGLPEDIVEARHAGFDHHLVKPPSLATLVDVLASATTDPVAADRST